MPPSVDEVAGGSTVAARVVASDIVTRPPASGKPTSEEGQEALVFVWSAYDEGGLKRIAEIYGNYLRECDLKKPSYKFLKDLAYTLLEKRSRLSWKSFAVATSVEDLKAKLEGGLPPPIRSISNPKLGYVFTGQGAQWAGMGRELLKYPVYRNSLQDAQDYFRELGSSWALIGLAHPSLLLRIDMLIPNRRNAET